MMQVSLAAPDKTAATAEALSAHPAFTLKNPNRFRAVFGALSATMRVSIIATGNPTGCWPIS